MGWKKYTGSQQTGSQHLPRNALGNMLGNVHTHTLRLLRHESLSLTQVTQNLMNAAHSALHMHKTNQHMYGFSATMRSLMSQMHACRRYMCVRAYVCVCVCVVWKFRTRCLQRKRNAHIIFIENENFLKQPQRSRSRLPVGLRKQKRTQNIVLRSKPTQTHTHSNCSHSLRNDFHI